MNDYMIKNIRILYLLSGPSMFDGSTKSLINLVRGLKMRGVDICIVCPSRKGVYEYLTKEGFNAIPLKYCFSTMPGFKSFREKLYFIPKVLRRFVLNNIAQIRLYFICKRVKPDLIHTNTTALSIGYHVAKHLKIPHIWHIREYGDLDFHMNMKNIKLYLLDSNNYTISITKDIAAHRNVLNRNESRIIYNGIFNRSDIRYNPKKENYFLFAGRIQVAKGLKELILSYIDFCESRPNVDCRLLIAEGVVDEPYKNMVKKIIKENNISNRVEWLGNRADIGELMSKSLAVIIPSLYEGFGRVMAEAMFNGALVIGRNTGGTKEQFDNGLTLTGSEIGLRFLTVVQCADCMRRVVDEGTDKFENMILDGQKTVAELYSNESYVDNAMSFYRYILQI